MENTAVETVKHQAQVQIDLLQYSSGEANCLFEGKHTLFMSLPEPNVVHFLVANSEAVTFYQKCRFTSAEKTEPIWIYEGEDP